MAAPTIDRSGAAIYKTATATVTKVDDTGDTGGFEALVAVFGNKDSQGDVVIRGAFAEAIANGRVFPSLWAHQFGDDTAIIASFTAQETDEGLLVSAKFLNTPRAQNIRALMEAGLVKEFSWSGRVTEGAWVETDDDWWYEIRKVDLWEAGPCFKGANEETELLGVKSGIERLATKEGRILAQKHVDALKDAHTILGELITAVDKVADEEETKSADTPELPGTESGEPDADVTTPAFNLTTIKARLALS